MSRHRAVGKRAVLEALSEELSVERVLERCPGWTEEGLRSLLQEAARFYPSDGEDVPEGAVVAFIDGASRGNPGESGYGVVFKDARGTTLLELSGYLGEATNNVAEYQGLLAALEEALHRGWKDLKVFSDSELLVRQLKGLYRVKSPALKGLYSRGLTLCRSLESWSVEHIGRQDNARADELANNAIDDALKGRR